MKSQDEIVALRRRLLVAIKGFAERHEQSFVIHQMTPEQIHLHALGALAFADAILELDRPANLEKALLVLESN